MRYVFRCTPILLLVVGLCPVFAQEAGWKVSVVSTSSDSPMFVSSGEYKSQKSLAWPGRPPGHRWIAATVEVTSPSKDSAVAAANIKINAKDASYPVTAVGFQAKPKDAVVYFPLLLLDAPYADTGMKEAGNAQRGPGVWSTIYLMTPEKQLEPTWNGYYSNSRGNKLLFRVTHKPGPKGREILFSKSPLSIVLLFAVPESAVDLQLKFGEVPGTAVPLPA